MHVYEIDMTKILLKYNRLTFQAVYSMNGVSKPLLIRNTLKSYNTDMCV